MTSAASDSLNGLLLPLIKSFILPAPAYSITIANVFESVIIKLSI